MALQLFVNLRRFGHVELPRLTFSCLAKRQLWRLVDYIRMMFVVQMETTSEVLGTLEAIHELPNIREDSQTHSPSCCNQFRHLTQAFQEFVASFKGYPALVIDLT